MNQHKKKICIIGCGTFGSYLLKRLLEKNGDQIDITVVEIGNRKTQDEKEIGLDSISEHSSVSKDGRYFGFGGTSARWGGQVLFFDERDNPENDDSWNEIIRINNAHKDIVLKKLLGSNSKFDLAEKNKNIKTGIWLKYIKRNLFNRLTKKELKKINLLSDQRVVDFDFKNNKINKIICKNKEGHINEISADVFYLTAGALESCRLLLTLNKKTGILNKTDLGKNFGDHISTELFHIKNTKPVINGIDFTPRLYKGSLITQRMIVQTDKGVIGFLHGVFNKDIKAFKFLKELLFGKKTTTVTFSEFISGFIFLFKFVFHLLFKNKLYVDKNQWSLQLDMEQPVPNSNQLTLADQKDQYGEAVLKIDWDISKNDLDAIAEMRKKIEILLQKNNLEHIPLYNPAFTNNKVEDVYHPVGCLRMGSDENAVINFNGRVKGIENLFHFSTGIFPSAKSINPSAAVMCFIEECLNKN
ncbi:MAG: GMC family oxidoreductase [Saprospiraceae bacterium]